MLSLWDRWVWNANSQFVLFFLLLVLSHLVYLLLFRGIKANPYAGLIVASLASIALIVFALFNISTLLSKLITLEVVIIWLYIAANLFESYLADNLDLKVQANQLAVGTWVLGTLLPLLLFIQVVPMLYGFILLQTIVITLLGLCFFIFCVLIVINYLRPATQELSAFIFLLPVNIEAFAILLNELFRGYIPLLVYQSLILFGIVCYLLLSLIMLVYIIHRKPKKLVFVDQQYSFALLYAAPAMAGLAMLNTISFPESILQFVWFFALAVLLLIEVRALLLWYKNKHKNFTYHTQQWTRVLAIAIFYQFTYIYSPYAVNDSVRYLAQYGQYVVLALFAFQLLFLLLTRTKMQQSP